MPRADVLARRRVVGRGAWASLAARGILSLATLVGAIYCLAVHWQSDDAGPFAASAGVVSLAAFVAQMRFILRGWRSGRLFVTPARGEELAFWRRLAAGAVAAYGLALLAGPGGSAACVAIAALAAWYAILLLPLASAGGVLEGWRQWSAQRGTRRLAWLAYAALLAVVVGEGSLRLARVFESDVWRYEILGLETDVVARADMGEANAAPLRPRSGALRLALVGGDATRGTPQMRQCLRRVESTLPGMEIISLASPPDASSGRISAALAECHADLAVIVFSACEELAHEPLARDYFDWRQLELVRWCGGGASQLPADACMPAGDDFESHLGALAPQLTVCRTPIDERMRSRWQRALARLDVVLIGCRESRLPAVLVVVPSAFQLDGALRETLARRTGAAADQLDVELPQRRIAGYADQRHVPLLDLLPHLRLAEMPLYEPNAARWNDDGYAAAAGAIGSWLEGRLAGQPALAARVSRAP